MATPRAGYYLEDRTRVPGVTTVLGRFKESGGLLHWAFKQGCEQTTELLTTDCNFAPNLYRVRDEAGASGTLAHEMVEIYINGGDHMIALHDQPKDRAQDALNAFQMFREWEENSKIEIISKWQEIQMVSEKYGYGGTPDAIGRNQKGQLVLLDWKTSNAIYSDYGLQLAAYAALWEENGNEPITGGFHICRFSKEFPDFSHHYYGNLDLEWQQFKLYIEAYKLDKLTKKRYK